MRDADAVQGLQRFARAFQPEVHRVVVRGREHVEPDLHQVLHAARVRAKAEQFQVRRQVVAVRYHGFEIGEVDVAVDLACDQQRRLIPSEPHAVLYAVACVDLLEAAVEAGVACKNDSDLRAAIRTRGQGGECEDEYAGDGARTHPSRMPQ